MSDYRCTLRDPDCPVYAEVERHNLIMRRLKYADIPDRARREKLDEELHRFRNEIKHLQTVNCKECGWEYTVSTVRKLHPTPLVRDAEGLLQRT